MSRAQAFECVTLHNGHGAIRHLGHGEIMHPSVGPWAEANTLYVEQSKLAERLAERNAAPLCVYDVGLGAAANATAALACARALGAGRNRPLTVLSFEVDLEPLELALARPDAFPYLQPFAEAARELLRRGAVDDHGSRWELLHGDVRESLTRTSLPADVVFHDPFSPKSNPELWTEAFFTQLRSRCTPSHATLFTYSAATPTRVSLLLGGFAVGYGRAIGSKKETTAAATSTAALEKPLGAEWLARWRRSTQRAPYGGALTDEVEARISAIPQLQ